MTDSLQDPITAPNVRVVVVGPCASGKTTLVENLRIHGYDAYVCAQEHSVVPDLWAHQHPDFLIALQADLCTIRKRRGPNWPETIFNAQMERLAGAYRSANLTIDTAREKQQSALDRSIAFLQDATRGDQAD